MILHLQDPLYPLISFSYTFNWIKGAIMDIGLIGLGRMGGNMVKRLLGDGHAVKER